jgi:hypothetical protein
MDYGKQDVSGRANGPGECEKALVGGGRKGGAAMNAARQVR